MDKKETVEAGNSLPQPLGSAVLKVEVWECRACDRSAPCRVEITYSDDKLPTHLKDKHRFRRRACICDESPFPAWDLVTPNKRM